MYEEYISKLQPKGKLNLKWYQDEDRYSEGDVEELVLKLIANYDPADYTDAIYEHFSWSAFYHLSHVRENILNWYPFEKDSSVLEIGCGMGAITGLLCDRCRNVTAVELSKRRATAALLRNREKENLEIIVGNLNDIPFKNQFDYITLIGVLEYQGSYTDSAHPYLDFLKKVRSLLKPGGKLLIAIENQYGLKYWCGAKEDHTGLPFDGLNQYTFSEKKARTFSRQSLDDLVRQSGFEHTFFYYPMPDYKLPTVVYSQLQLPMDSATGAFDGYYIPDCKGLIAQERKIWQDVIENGAFEFFANSFLVECTDEESRAENRVTYANLNEARHAEYRIGTRFIGNERVQKFPMSSASGDAHIENILNNELQLEKHGLKILKSERKDGTLETEFVIQELLEHAFMREAEAGNLDRVYAYLDEIHADILRSCEHAAWEENILYSFELGIPEDKELFGAILKTGYLDMIMRNAFATDNGLLWFDQEWTLEYVPAGYVFYRMLNELYASHPELESIISFQSVGDKYGIGAAMPIYNQIEGLLLNVLIDKRYLAERHMFAPKNEMIVDNINKLIAKGG